MDMMTCPHCRQDIPRERAGKHLLFCAKQKRDGELLMSSARHPDAVSILQTIAEE